VRKKELLYESIKVFLDGEIDDLIVLK